MGTQATAGLRKRGAVWHIEKIWRGVRIYESTGTGDLEEAERYLAHRLNQIRESGVYGTRLTHTFEEAAARYLSENLHLKAIDRAGYALKRIVPVVGKKALEDVHSGTLDAYLEARRAAGVTAGTINREIGVIKRILALAARAWRDEHGRPWLASVPLLPVVKGAVRKPRPITWAEQARLFNAMPAYLGAMALFMVNTGLRDQELCGLRWEWECRVGSTDARVFVLPESITKNGRERIVPLNPVALSVIADRRRDDGYVFTLDGHRIQRMNNRAWKLARREAGLTDVRVHDLRHTFGMRLRAAGVGLEDRQDLLGHHAGRITTHYSQAEIARLLECVERLCEDKKRPEIALVRRA